MKSQTKPQVKPQVKPQTKLQTNARTKAQPQTELPPQPPLKAKPKTRPSIPPSPRLHAAVAADTRPRARAIDRYDAPHQFEPLLPAESVLGPLLERASDLSRAATQLGGAAAPAALGELRGLLRSMNSYYTNRIEGEHTRPSDIERALQQDFSANLDLARKQRLALAHIHTEEICEAELRARGASAADATAETSARHSTAADTQTQASTEAPGTPHDPAAATQRWLYSTEALCGLHRHLFQGLPAADRALASGGQLVPGQLRQADVAIGRHHAPAHAALPAFMARWALVYSGVRRGEAAVVALAAAHHRLAWMHPFMDGNGRVARLHTHLLLHASGLSNGLWSPLRGFARSEARYKALLQAADEHRRGDLDGRGNLTQAGLLDWVHYVLDICIDQVQFMAQQLNVASMRQRIAAALAFDAAQPKTGVRTEALMPLHYLFVAETEIGRADFKTMTGLGDRVATETVSALLRRGYLASDTPYGKLRLAIPRHALRFYFPALWPEAEQEQAALLAQAVG